MTQASTLRVEPTGEQTGAESMSARTARITVRRGPGVIARIGPPPARALHLRVLMSCAPAKEQVPTKDPFDRAHDMRDEDGLLIAAGIELHMRHTGMIVRAKAIPGAKARRYHPSQLTAAGVAPDSVFDATYEVMLELDGVPGIGAREQSPSAASQRNVALDRMRTRKAFDRICRR